MKKILNSKALYIVLLVLSALSLLASAAARLLVRENLTVPSAVPSGQDVSSLFSGSGMSGFPGFSTGDGRNFNLENMPSFDGSGSFSFPGGSGSFSFPGGSGSFSFPGGSGNFSIPGSTDAGGSPAVSGITGILSLLQGIRKNWLPIALVSLAVMTLSILRLVMISRQEEKIKEEAEAKKRKGMSEDQLLKLRVREEAEQEARAKNRRKTKNIILAGVLAALVAFVIIVGRLLTPETVSSGVKVEEKLISASVETGSVRSVIKGAGTVSFGEAIQVTLPGSISVEKWLAAEGDRVEEGERIAKLDLNSLADAIAEIRTALNELDAKLAGAAKDMPAAEIKASAGGRVIRIYAKEGTEVSELMTENGALLVISLDGNMALTIPQTDGIVVGTEVKLTASDGTFRSGKIAAKNQTEMVVTVSDEWAAAGMEVTVTDEKGAELGCGALYVHSELRVTGYTGTVASVPVSEGTEIKAGDVLITLDGTDYSLSADQLRAKRETLTAQLDTLLRAYRDGYLYANADGLLTEPRTESDGSAALTGYVLEEAALCSITDDGQMQVEIQADEKDISLVREGTSVTVSLDAYPGRSFPGTVLHVSTEGSSDGGSAKYSVTVSLSAEEKILAGMNASVILTREEKTDVPLIPLDAVYEQGSKIFVYTSYDEENDRLGNPVEIDLGLSDGKNAEILSGLTAGTEFYYRYAGTITYSFLNRP